MCTLNIEHRIGNFATWKAAFDRDPAKRARAGVRRYRVLRPAHDPDYVIIDLDFDTSDEARAFLATMQRVWGNSELSPGLSLESGAERATPRARILEQVASVQY